METFLATMNRVSQAWLQWMWPMAWQVALMGVVILGVELLARKASPRFRYFLWCLVLLKLCLPPSLVFVTGVGQWVLPKQATAVPVLVSSSTVTAATSPEGVAAPVLLTSRPESAPAVSVPQAAIPATVPIARAASHVSWLMALWGAWCLGVLVLIFLFLIQHRRVGRLLVAAQPVNDKGVLRLLEEAKAALGMSSRVTLLSVEKLHSPILFGVFRPRIAIPRQALKSLPHDQIRPILLHELAHLRRKDLGVSFVQLLVQVLYWFHPVVWLANRQLRRERELIVDDIVLAKLQGQRESYSASLLSILKQGAQRQFFAPAYVGIIETTRSLTARLKRILDAKRKLSLRLGWLGLTILIVLGLALIPQARSQDRQGEQQISSKAASAEERTDARKSSNITGRVVDAASGQPVKVFNIRLAEPKTGKTPRGIGRRDMEDGVEFANPEGRFTMTVNEPEAAYRLIIVAPGYNVAELDNVRPGAPAEVRLQKAQTVIVHVRDTAQGTDVAEADVRFYYYNRAEWLGDSALTVQNLRIVSLSPFHPEGFEKGRYTFSGVASGTWILEVLAPGYARYVRAFTDGVKTNEIAVAVSKKGEIAVELSKSGTLTGRLRPLAGMFPEDFTVSYDIETNWARSPVDADGHFRLENVPPGSVTISLNAEAKLHLNGCWPVTVEPGKVTELDLDLAKFVILEGRFVRDAGASEKTGFLAENSGMVFYNTRNAILAFGQPGADGRYTVALREPGLYHVSYRSAEGRRNEFNIQAAIGRQTMDIAVPSGKISGTVAFEKPSTYPVWVVSVGGFTVISGDEAPEMAQAIAEVLAGEGSQNTPRATRATLQEAVQAKDTVLVMHAGPRVYPGGGRRTLPDVATGKEILDALKQKKVIGVGSAAADFFLKVGLEIGGGAGSYGDTPVEMNVEKNATIGQAWLGQRIVATKGSPDFKTLYFNEAMYIPGQDPRCSIVDVIARDVGEGKYAPVVRQGDYVLTSVEVPPSAWSPTYRRFFRDLALAMQARPLEPFATAKWEITKPGAYELELAKGFTSEGSKTFYFKFARPTQFAAQLEHQGSNGVMLLLHGGKFQIRKDSAPRTYPEASPPPLDISVHITSDDIQNMGDKYLEVQVSNWDRGNTARCKLTIKYEK